METKTSKRFLILFQILAALGIVSMTMQMAIKPSGETISVWGGKWQSSLRTSAHGNSEKSLKEFRDSEKSLKEFRAESLAKISTLHGTSASLREAAKKRWDHPDCSMEDYEDDWSAPVIYKPREEAIIIFTYGKCGTVTLGSYFRDRYGTNNIFQIHSMKGDLARKINRFKKVWIVTATRNRYVRDLSALVENIGKYAVTQTTSVESVLEQWWSRCGPGCITHDWFTHTIKGALPTVDIASHASDFDWQHRHLFFQAGEGNRYQTLLMRYEDIQYWPQILSKFFPAKAAEQEGGKRMPSVNHKAGWKVDLYNKLLALTPFNEDEIMMHRQGETAFFYTECELDHFDEAARHPLTEVDGR